MSRASTVPRWGDDDLTGRAYRSIRRMIVEGGLPPGKRVSHRTLAAQLGIGRSPVRDALLRLESEGLLVQQGQRGVLLRELSPKELGEIYELRLVMEPFTAERAAVLADVGQLAALKRVCDEMTAVAAQPDRAAWLAAEDNRRRLTQLDLQFHTTILEAAGNTVAVKFFGTAQVLALTFAWYLSNDQRGGFSFDASADRLGATATEHEAIAAAIRNRDPVAAREAMRLHVADAILVVPERYASLVQSESEAAEKAAAKRAARAVR